MSGSVDTPPGCSGSGHLNERSAGNAFPCQLSGVPTWAGHTAQTSIPPCTVGIPGVAVVGFVHPGGWSKLVLAPDGGCILFLAVAPQKQMATVG